MNIDEAISNAVRASKSDRCVYYVIKVRGGYDFCQKGFLTPTDAKIVKSVTEGRVKNV